MPGQVGRADLRGADWPDYDGQAVGVVRLEWIVSVIRAAEAVSVEDYLIGEDAVPDRNA